MPLDSKNFRPEYRGPVKVERLERLVVVLRKVPVAEFDLGSWDCGMTACAIGHAARDSWFQDRGLSMLRDPWGYSIPRVDGDDSMSALSDFFGLSGDEGRWLFSPDKYIDCLCCSPAAVITRIEFLLAACRAEAEDSVSCR